MIGILFGILVTAVLGAGAGYFVGTAIGRTSEGTPLPTTIRLTRERLSSTAARLENAATKLNASQKSELAGAALVLSRRIAELSSSLGAIERKAKQPMEVAA